MPKPHETHPSEFRGRALACHGEPAQLPVLREIAEEIHACCGHNRLKSTRLAWGWSVHEAVDRLAAVAEGDELPERGADNRAWRRWESGQHPDADYQDRLGRLFKTGPVQLGFAADHTPCLSGGDRTKRRDVLRLGAAALAAPGLLTSPENEARELTRRSEETDLGPTSLAHLHQVIADYGRHYARYSADELWQHALGDRRHVAQLLDRRMTLKQRREVFVAAAWLSLVLAWAAHDRGDIRAALAFAADARHHADEAEHPEAAAWSWDVEATTWLYNDQFEQALRAAQQGMALASAGSAAQVRLTGQTARAHARLGHSAPASDALGQLRRQAEQHPPHTPGLFSADAVRSWSIAATSSLWLGHDQQARLFAEQAMEVYERNPNASPTRRALTALDLGQACARLGDPEQAVAHGLVALSTPRHAAVISIRTSKLCLTLEHTYPKAAAVAQFRQNMDELTLSGQSREITDRSL